MMLVERCSNVMIAARQHAKNNGRAQHATATASATAYAYSRCCGPHASLTTLSNKTCPRLPTLHADLLLSVSCQTARQNHSSSNMSRTFAAVCLVLCLGVAVARAQAPAGRAAFLGGAQLCAQRVEPRPIHHHPLTPTPTPNPSQPPRPRPRREQGLHLPRRHQRLLQDHPGGGGGGKHGGQVGGAGLLAPGARGVCRGRPHHQPQLLRVRPRAGRPRVHPGLLVSCGCCCASGPQSAGRSVSR